MGGVCGAAPLPGPGESPSGTTGRAPGGLRGGWGLWVCAGGAAWLCDLPRFRNVIFDIVPCREPGRFQVKAQFMGIDMERFQLHYQVGAPRRGGGG